MKKKTIKSLTLNKNKVSSLIDSQVIGGTSGSTTFGVLSYRGWTCPTGGSENNCHTEQAGCSNQ